MLSSLSKEDLAETRQISDSEDGRTVALGRITRMEGCAGGVPVHAVLPIPGQAPDSPLPSLAEKEGLVASQGLKRPPRVFCRPSLGERPREAETRGSSLPRTRPRGSSATVPLTLVERSPHPEQKTQVSLQHLVNIMRGEEARHKRPRTKGPCSHGPQSRQTHGDRKQISGSQRLSGGRSGQ